MDQGRCWRVAMDQGRCSISRTRCCLRLRHTSVEDALALEASCQRLAAVVQANPGLLAGEASALLSPAATCCLLYSPSCLQRCRRYTFSAGTVGVASQRARCEVRWVSGCGIKAAPFHRPQRLPVPSVDWLAKSCGTGSLEAPLAVSPPVQIAGGAGGSF